MSINTIFTKNDQITVHQAKDLVQSGHPVSMVLPLWFRLPDESWWLFPIEPLLSISGQNIVIRRYVAKSEKRGTVKERWAEDDLSINIQGSFVNKDLYTYPENELSILYQAITQRKAIGVQNDLLQLLNVHQIVVEPYSFPFSKGENVQNFTINAYSDDITELFIEVNNV